jgi:hypothetical protein
MTHTGPMRETEGTFYPEPLASRYCGGRCRIQTFHHCWRWESNDGAYVDRKYQCVTCGHVHWVEGIDS